MRRDRRRALELSRNGEAARRTALPAPFFELVRSAFGTRVPAARLVVLAILFPATAGADATICFLVVGEVLRTDILVADQLGSGLAEALAVAFGNTFGVLVDTQEVVRNTLVEVFVVETC